MPCPLLALAAAVVLLLAAGLAIGLTSHTDTCATGPGAVDRPDPPGPECPDGSPTASKPTPSGR